MLILILIDVQYSQSAIFSFKKVRIVKITPPQVLITTQKNPVNKFSPAKFMTPPTPYHYLQNPAYFKKDSHSARRKHD